MYEVETKVRADHDPLRDRLTTLGADHLGRVRQVDTYYNAPDRDFAATDEALRVRRETDRGEAQTVGETDRGETQTVGENGDAGRVLLTYKGPLVDEVSKTREEAETRVVDGEQLRAILDGLGYEPAATVEKHRDRYAVGDCRVTLDRVTDLGEFVEVEFHDPVPEAELDRARRTVADLLGDLGLDPDDGIQTSYLGLLLAGD